jgi:hypothetical protein
VRDRERGATRVVDTLSRGYAVVNKHPWVLVLPILLDIFFWMGPRLSIAPLVQSVMSRVPTPDGLTEEMLQSYSSLQQSTTQIAESFNLFSLLSTSFPGLPSLMAGKEAASQSIDLASASSAATATLLLIVAGSLLGALYYTSVAQAVREERSGLLGAAWLNWLRLMGLLLLAIVVTTGLAVPIIGIVLLIATVLPAAVGLVGSFLWVTGIWVMFYLFFVVDAVVISGAGPFRAIRNSFAVVRYNLGPSLGLIILIWIITLGLPIVWGSMLDNPITATMAVLGNVYVSTGLAAASMIFYRERFAALPSRLGDRK